MKKTVAYVLGAVLVVTIAGMAWCRGKETNLQQSIAGKIIRFHVIANSDSDDDQELKLKVKEHVVEVMEPMLSSASSVDEAREVMQMHLGDIEQAALDTLQAEGSSYEVHARLEDCYFPVKTYGEFTFPDGEYEALRVVIGEGEGKNWWCVMYPRLCFVDSLYTVVPEESKKELKKQLTDEEYEEILKGEKSVKIKCRLLEWLGF